MHRAETYCGGDKCGAESSVGFGLSTYTLDGSETDAGVTNKAPRKSANQREEGRR